MPIAQAYAARGLRSGSFGKSNRSHLALGVGFDREYDAENQESRLALWGEGSPMKTVGLCLRHAEECEALAKMAMGHGHREQLLDLAGSWRLVAHLRSDMLLRKRSRKPNRLQT